MTSMKFRQGNAIPRLREMTTAFILSEEEKAGPVLNALTPTHIAQVQRAFSTEGGSTGMGAWPQLSPRYAAWKIKQGFAQGILVLTGQFKEAATTMEGLIREYTRPNIYGFGFSSIVGLRHEIGTGIMPRRSIIEKTDADMIEFTQTFQAFWIARAKSIIRNIGRLKK